MDLTKEEPRGPDEQLGGYVWLPRLIDKARAKEQGTLGDFISPCPMDRRFCDLAGVPVQGLIGEVSAGRSDDEIVTWLDRQVPRSTDEKRQVNDEFQGRSAA